MGRDLQWPYLTRLDQGAIKSVAAGDRSPISWQRRKANPPSPHMVPCCLCSAAQIPRAEGTRLASRITQARQLPQNNPWSRSFRKTSSPRAGSLPGPADGQQNETTLDRSSLARPLMPGGFTSPPKCRSPEPQGVKRRRTRRCRSQEGRKNCRYPLGAGSTPHHTEKGAWSPL